MDIKHRKSWINPCILFCKAHNSGSDHHFRVIKTLSSYGIISGENKKFLCSTSIEAFLRPPQMFSVVQSSIQKFCQHLQNWMMEPITHYGQPKASHKLSISGRNPAEPSQFLSMRILLMSHYPGSLSLQVRLWYEDLFFLFRNKLGLENITWVYSLFSIMSMFL